VYREFCIITISKYSIHAANINEPFARTISKSANDQYTDAKYAKSIHRTTIPINYKYEYEHYVKPQF
jgi:hypothetical protein